MPSDITAKRLRQLLDYDPVTGVFRWKVQRGRVSVGEVAGHIHAKHGRVNIKVGRKLYRAHRLAWLYVHGEWPELDIDHSNGNPSDNRLSNLRQATKTQNQANCGLQKNNKSGLKGVSWHSQNKKWRSEIQINGKRKYLGQFDDPMEAHQRYLEEAIRLFGEFARAA